MKKIIQNRTILFIVSICLLTTIFMFFSYFTIMKNYVQIEKNENIKHIKNFINTLENRLLQNKEQTDYLINLNKKYNSFSQEKIEKKIDFLLNSFNIDYFIITKNDKIDFEKSNNTHKIKNINVIKNEILHLHKNINSFNTIKQINTQLFFINKSKIDKNYSFYTIKQIQKEEFKNLVLNFSNIKLINEHLYEKEKLTSKSFEKIFLKSSVTTTFVTTKISFYGLKNKFLFSLELQNSTLFVKEAKEIMTLFCIFLTIFLILLFYITYLYQKTVKEHNSELENRVEERTLQISSALKELEKVNLKLYDLAHTDFLTKTMNRRHFFMHAKNAFNTTNKELNTLCVIMIDIDNFKRLNDSFGHDLGDRVLISFSKCVKQCIKENTIFGRLGGEEFAIVLEHTKLNEAIKIANRIRKNIEKIELVTKNENIHITASFGVSDIKNCSSIDEMLQKADTHLYSAKNSGKNRVRSRLNLI